MGPGDSRPFTVAIMQPYFLPYAGYFRLFAAADLFVIYDCVQFPRRGWVHRNKLIDRTGAARWLTLPLEKAPQEEKINNLRFPSDAKEVLAFRLRSFAIEVSEAAQPILNTLHQVEDSPSIYLERLLRSVAGYCGLPWNVTRSSALDLPEDLHGQDRILEIARRLGAERYVNSPGGRDLYESPAFEAAGIELRFLSDYAGPKTSILQRIVQDGRDRLLSDIQAQTVLAP